MRNKGFLFLFFLLVFASIIGFTYDIYSESISRENVTVTHINSEVVQNGIEIEKEIKEGKHFTTSVNLPVSGIDEIDNQIKAWAQQMEENFYMEIDALKAYNNKKNQAHFVVEPIVNKIGKQWLTFELYVQSIITDPFTNEDLFHSEVKTIVIDIKKNKLLNLNDLFKFKSKNESEKMNELIGIISTKKNKKQLKPLASKQLSEIEWVLTKNGILLFIENAKSNHQLDRIFIDFENLEQYLTKPYAEKFTPIKKEITKRSNKKGNDNHPKYIALTFDDGPDEKVTPAILNILKKYDIKATFFMLANSANKYPKIAKLVADAGHDIANHSETHINLNTVNRKRIEREILQSQQLIKEITGKKPTLFRPPYGEYNQAVLDISTKSNQTIIMWSVDTLDWQHRNKERTYEIIKNNVQPGSIILMHDIHQSTADALPKIIESLQKDGYEFLPVSELIKEIDSAPNKVYYGK